MSSTIQQIIDLETSQIGVIEKPINLTPYANELDAVEHPRIPRQGSAWCGTFQDWAFWKVGAIGALPMRSFSTVPAAQAYMRRGMWYADPQPGDLAFLHNAGGHGHVGYVIEVPHAGQVVTIEGNTSSGAGGSQTNGGQVAKRIRAVKFWAGFGRPDYPQPVPNDALTGLGELINAARSVTLKRGDKGIAVTVLQSRLGGLVVDGDFGGATEKSVRAFQAWYQGAQRAKGITVNAYLLQITGIVEAHTWSALLGDLAT